MNSYVKKPLFALCAAAFAILAACGAPVAPTPAPATQTLPLATPAPYLSGIPEVVQRVSPSVVGIATFSRGAQGSISGIGSGVIVHQDGFVLTNAHVAGNVETLAVIFQDGTRASGQTLWADAALDLAVVKIEPGRPAAPLARSADVVVGESVVAIGTPLTLQFQHTVTSGVVSAVNRVLQMPAGQGESFLENLIQTDAPINPGNSGGPLLNLRGEIIGINTVKVTQAEGIGFAVPVDIATPIIDHLAREGSFETPYLGVYALDAAMATYYDERISLPEGLMVLNVAPGSPAEAAGLTRGDILISADGEKLSTMLDLRIALVRRSIGEPIALEIRRDGQSVTVSPILASKPR